jgi:diguanylate cyclase (GGDEF)-like protein
LEYYWERTHRWFSITVFSPQESYFVTLFEDITAHKAAENKLRTHSEYLLSLNELTLGLFNRLNLDDLLSVMVSRAVNLLDNSSGCLYLLCDDGLHVQRVASSGFQSTDVGLVHRKDQGLVHQVIVGEKAVVVKDYRNWEHRLELKEFENTRAIVGFPIFADSKVYGVLQVEFQHIDRQFSAEEVELLDRFARLASIALDNALLYKRSLTEIQERQIVEDQLKHMALHDGLTNLYNRSYFEEELHRQEIRRSGSVGIIVCDVDGLKLVNDTLGHAAGDKLLIAVADILRQSFRDSDVVARIGGDEFAILLPNTLPEIIEKGLGRIRASITQTNNNSEKSMISISIGWAISASPAELLSDAFKEADTNMYREKLQQSRSNRTVMVQTLIHSVANKDYSATGHGDRLEDISTKLAAALNLPEKKIIGIQLLAQFHDLGKVGIPDTLLNKEGILTEADIIELRRHPEIGYRIAQVSPELLPIADYILKHHEWWNGKGYPLGLSGEAIPIECRILAIADAFDAMTSARPYRNSLSVEDACAELKRCAGTQFDPAIVDLFIALHPSL